MNPVPPLTLRESYSSSQSSLESVKEKRWFSLPIGSGIWRSTRIKLCGLFLLFLSFISLVLTWSKLQMHEGWNDRWDRNSWNSVEEEGRIRQTLRNPSQCIWAQQWNACSSPLGAFTVTVIKTFVQRWTRIWWKDRMGKLDAETVNFYRILVSQTMTHP